MIGLAVLEKAGNLVKLGAQSSRLVLLELEELPGIHPIGQRTRLGLYHTAFLLPSRSALSSFVHHLGRQGIQFGAGDHLYSEAIYLEDPDGLSVEVYADRPRAEWLVENRELATAVDPVRFETFPVVAVDSWRGAPAGTTMEHAHFYVRDLEQAKKFYHSGLGLDITTWRYPGALFTSAGGYHHHVRLNVWVAAPPASMTDSRLLFWEILLPNGTEVQRAAESLVVAGFPPLKTETVPTLKIPGASPWRLRPKARKIATAISDKRYWSPAGLSSLEVEYSHYVEFSAICFFFSHTDGALLTESLHAVKLVLLSWRPWSRQMPTAQDGHDSEPEA